MRHGKKKKDPLGAVSNAKTFKQAQDQIQFPLRSTEISIKRKVLHQALCPCLFPFHRAKRCQPQRGWSRLPAGCVGLSPRPAVRLQAEHKPLAARTNREGTESSRPRLILRILCIPLGGFKHLYTGSSGTFLLSDPASCRWRKKKSEEKTTMGKCAFTNTSNFIINVTAAILKMRFQWAAVVLDRSDGKAASGQEHQCRDSQFFVD